MAGVFDTLGALMREAAAAERALSVRRDELAAMDRDTAALWHDWIEDGRMIGREPRADADRLARLRAEVADAEPRAAALVAQAHEAEAAAAPRIDSLNAEIAAAADDVVMESAIAIAERYHAHRIATMVCNAQLRGLRRYLVERHRGELVTRLNLLVDGGTAAEQDESTRRRLAELARVEARHREMAHALRGGGPEAVGRLSYPGEAGGVNDG